MYTDSLPRGGVSPPIVMINNDWIVRIFVPYIDSDTNGIVREDVLIRIWDVRFRNEYVRSNLP